MSADLETEISGAWITGMVRLVSAVTSVPVGGVPVAVAVFVMPGASTSDWSVV